MKPGLTPGSRHVHRFTVGEGQLVPALFGGGAFPDMPAVFATGQMFALMEWGCVEHLRPFYENGEDSLGIAIDVDHRAATLPGQTVTIESEVTEVEPRRVRFRVSAHDGVDLIGQGTHARAVIDRAKFDAKLAAKRAALDPGV